MGFNDLVKFVNLKNINTNNNIKNTLLSPKKFYEKHVNQINSPKILNTSGHNYLNSGNNNIPNTTKNRKQSLNRKPSKVNL